EEVYVYRFDRPDGFGVQVRYDDSGEQAIVVRDGHVDVPAGAGLGYELDLDALDAVTTSTKLLRPAR
ncbi:MAG TPA: hypothetical protein VGK49_02165, partial [Ilumatobacteraceae bacterium]